jgi:hypothetical protein
MNAKPSSASCEEAPASWLRRLWERMTALYGHAWLSVHGPSPQSSDGTLTIHGETWSKVLSGLSGTQLGHGLEACITSGREFPPSAPRFRSMCLQLPSFISLKAQFDAVRYQEKDAGPFARLVCQFLNYDSYRYGDKKTSDKALKEAYELASEQLMRGGSYPPEPVAAISNAPVKPRELSEEERAEKEQAEERRAAARRASAEAGFAHIRRALEMELEEAN